MTHNHGYEYQIKIVREDDTEELSGWMDSAEKVVQLTIAAHKPQGKSCWLMVRNIICPNCSEREQIIEHPIIEVLTPRCAPRDSRYLQVAGVKDRCDLSIHYKQY